VFGAFAGYSDVDPTANAPSSGGFQQDLDDDVPF
jgi:hypothetical protein